MNCSLLAKCLGTLWEHPCSSFSKLQSCTLKSYFFFNTLFISPLETLWPWGPHWVCNVVNMARMTCYVCVLSISVHLVLEIWIWLWSLIFHYDLWTCKGQSYYTWTAKCDPFDVSLLMKIFTWNIAFDGQRGHQVRAPNDNFSCVNINNFEYQMSIKLKHGFKLNYFLCMQDRSIEGREKESSE